VRADHYATADRAVWAIVRVAYAYQKDRARHGSEGDCRPSDRPAANVSRRRKAVLRRPARRPPGFIEPLLTAERP
jgi:hypothetical protein